MNEKSYIDTYMEQVLWNKLRRDWTFGSYADFIIMFMPRAET